MNKGIKIRLYPNKTQEEQINKLLGCYRFVYNQFLDKKIKSYNNNKVSETSTSLGKYFHHQLVEEYPWLKEQNTKVLKQTLFDLSFAFSMFFKGLAGFPNFKQKHGDKQSCRFEIGAISKKNDYSSNKLSLANIKNIKFRCSDKYKNYLIKYKDNIKSATLKRLKSGEYYLSILVDGDFGKDVKQTKSCVGIDLGIKDFVTTSDGEVFGNKHFKKKETNKLKRLNRQLSKKQKGSNNKNKIRLKIARLNRKITDRKNYYLHQVSNYLIDENQVIVMEDLNVKGMIKNHNLAESICEMNFGEFRRILEYKSKWYGRNLVFVDRFFPSSKKCHHCGYINKELKLSDRQWICPECGSMIERDYNAAQNILEEGIRILIGSSTTEFTPVESPTMDDRLRDEGLKSNDSMKQENYNEQFVQV